MSNESKTTVTTRQLHRLYWAVGLVLLIVAYLAYGGWRAYDVRSARAEAKALGWEVEYSEPSRTRVRNRSGIRIPWSLTTVDVVTSVGVPTGESYEENHRLIHRLNPTELRVLSARAVRDLTALKSVSGLKRLYVKDGTNLTNVDALKSLSSLTAVSLDGCTALTNVDGLKGLPALRKVWLRGCTSLTNVDALKSLPALEVADFYLSTGISKESVAALKVVQPNAGISGP